MIEDRLAKMSDEELLRRDINIMLNKLDNLVKEHKISRLELTDIIMRRSLLAQKHAMKCMLANLHLSVDRSARKVIKNLPDK